jgi:hypothetical protein
MDPKFAASPAWDLLRGEFRRLAKEMNPDYFDDLLAAALDEREGLAQAAGQKQLDRVREQAMLFRAGLERDDCFAFAKAYLNGLMRILDEAQDKGVNQ